jgi:hypothetical protein
MRMSMSKWEAITSVAEKLGPTPERSASGFVRLNVNALTRSGNLHPPYRLLYGACPRLRPAGTWFSWLVAGGGR